MVSDFRKKQKSPISNVLLVLGGFLVFMVLIFLIIADIKMYRRRGQLDTQIESLKSKIQNVQN